MKKFFSDGNKFFPMIVLLFLAIIWGSSFILIKKGLEAFAPLQVGTIRVLFASFFLLPIAIKYFKSYFTKHWKKFLILGITANLIPSILFAAAETGLSSSLAGILNSLTPIFTLIAGALFFAAPIKRKQVAGLTIGFTGSAALGLVGNNGELGSFNLYVLFVVAATICYGIGANMIKAYFSNMNSLIFTSLAFLSISPFALIYLLSTDFIYLLSTNHLAWQSLGYIFLLGAIGTALALVFFNRLIQITSPVFASMVTYLIPIIAVIWGIIDGDSLFPTHFAGMALVIFGVYLVNKKS